VSVAPVSISQVSRWTRIRSALTPEEWRRAALLAAVVLGLHAVGFFILVAVVAPHRYHLGASGVFGVGLGITAYTLGLRHALITSGRSTTPPANS
jgi:nickel/cobalt transporter (NiCoT) family protein